MTKLKNIRENLLYMNVSYELYQQKLSMNVHELLKESKNSLPNTSSEHNSDKSMKFESTAHWSSWM